MISKMTIKDSLKVSISHKVKKNKYSKHLLEELRILYYIIAKIMGLFQVLVFSVLLASVWTSPMKDVEDCDNNLVQLKRALSASKRILVCT